MEEHLRLVATPSAQMRLKALEDEIFRHVDQSVIAAYDGDQVDQALRLAERAQELLDSLKTYQAQEQRAGSASSSNSSAGGAKELQPVTTSVNYFELMLMVKSNLAAQLRRSGRLGEALDLYTELCRLASSVTGSELGIQIQQENIKTLLFKFGMNIGNVLFDMRDYQRALKYYRLTLDRLSTSAASSRNFRIKLMNNISVTLGRLLENDKSHLKNLELTTALDLLVKDNLSQTVPNQVSQMLEVINANHHRFGLNLMVVLHERKDLRAMLLTFKTLVETNISKHYELVIQPQITENEAPSDEHDEELDRFISGLSINRGRHESILDGTQGTTLIHTGVSSGDANLSREQKLNSVMVSINGDNLARAIRTREDQIRNSIVFANNLISDLEKELRGQKGSDGEDAMLIVQALMTEHKSTARYCDNLLETSPRYKCLLMDLRMNRLLEYLGKRDGLERAIKSMHRLKLDSVTCRSEKQAASNKHRAQMMDSGFIAVNRTAQAHQAKQVAMMPESTSFQSNVAMLRMLSNSPQEGDIRSIKLAIKSQPDDATSWLNLACCYFEKDSQKALACLRQALSLQAYHWEANYNLALLSRQKNYQINWSQVWDCLLGANDASGQPRAAPSMLIYQGQIIEVIQVLLATQAGMPCQRGNSILRDLINSSKRHPAEVYILLSKFISESSPSDRDARLTPMTLLSLGSQIHPYHMPLIERLIAMHISSFDYRAAENAITTCTKLRPDQVKWYRMLAECHLRASDYKRAITVYKEAIARFPLDSSCVKALAKLTKELGLTDEYESCQVKLEKLSKIAD